MATVEAIERLERKLCVKEAVVSDTANETVFMKLPAGARVIDIIANVEQAFSSADGTNPSTATVKLGTATAVSITDARNTGNARSSITPTELSAATTVSVSFGNASADGKLRVAVIYAKPAGTFYDVA